MSSPFSSCNQWTDEWAQKNQLSSSFVTQTESTNAWAKKDFSTSTGFSIYLADHQTQGRGRYQRTWTNAEPGSTLLSTWCISSPSGPQPILSARVGLRIFQILKTVFPTLPLSLKAPNDIYLGEGKLLGLLIEIENMGATTNYFFGIGMNVFAKPSATGNITSCLTDSTMVTRDLWYRFCHLLQTGLQDVCKDASRSNLLESEKKNLLEALNLHPTEKYQSIDSHGSLIRADGERVSWNEL